MAYLNHHRYELLSELFPHLTDIQTQCVLMYSLGLSSVEISEVVGVSRQMIDKNLHAAAKKMNVHSVLGIKPAVQIGLMFTILDKLNGKNDNQVH